MRLSLIVSVLVFLALLDGASCPAQPAAILSASVRTRPVTRGPVVDQPEIVSVQDDFRNGQLGWESGFADYAPINDLNGAMELEARIKPLPTELEAEGTGFYFRARNHSDDLFMFLKKKLTLRDGIFPSAAYMASFRIVFASNAGTECGGAGGSPGGSVYLKAGASGIEPRVVLTEEGQYRMTVDKGNQALGGPAGSVAGDISIDGSSCSDDAPFVSVERLHDHAYPVTSNPFGEIWILVGTDSGFEGITSLYYQAVSVTLTPLLSKESDSIVVTPTGSSDRAH